MTDFWSFIGAFGITAAAVAWLIKSLTVHLLGKDLEAYKTKIKYESEHENQLLLQKVALYKEVAHPIIKLISKTNYTTQVSKEDLVDFDRERMATTTMLAMFAPTEVYDSFNELVDYIFDGFDEKHAYFGLSGQLFRYRPAI